MPESRARSSYYKEGTAPQNKEELVIAYLPMIKKIAGKLSIALPPAIDQGDLVGSGIIGLLEAYERYDPSRKVPFSAYASARIRGGDDR
ncbi:MAG: sigma factor [Dethiobacteria bacterium]